MTTANFLYVPDSLFSKGEPLPSRTTIVNKYWRDTDVQRSDSTNVVDISNLVRTSGHLNKFEFIKKNSQNRNELVSKNYREEIKQVWIGTVIGFDSESIVARLEDCSDDDNPVEEVTLSIEEIEEQDRELIERGAQFYWHIGYRFGRNYSRERFSKIRFRRLAKWNQSELADAAALSEEYVNFFAQCTSNSP